MSPYVLIYKLKKDKQRHLILRQSRAEVIREHRRLKAIDGSGLFIFARVLPHSVMLRGRSP
ncbi:MAG TPA: hypothetical protein VGK23_09825 [Methanomassiliicoccales archaeon]